MPVEIRCPVRGHWMSTRAIPPSCDAPSAYDTAWQMLRTSGNVLAADYRAASTRELLAKRIIETARQGERDPIRLVDDALFYLENSNSGILPPGRSRADRAN